MYLTCISDRLVLFSGKRYIARVNRCEKRDSLFKYCLPLKLLLLLTSSILSCQSLKKLRTFSLKKRKL